MRARPPTSGDTGHHYYVVMVVVVIDSMEPSPAIGCQGANNSVRNATCTGYTDKRTAYSTEYTPQSTDCEARILTAMYPVCTKQWW